MQLPELNFRHRIALTSWLYGAGCLAFIPVLLALFWMRQWFALGAVLFLLPGLLMALRAHRLSLRRRFIREARLPPFLISKICEAYPQLTRRDAELVLHGLRQFFIGYLRSGFRFVAMPSKVVDTAWHEFILHTQGYESWCQAAFGRMLHHTPAEVLGKDPKRNNGLRRSWYWACKEESINPRRPSRLPLLFALDIKFDIAGGYRYQADCGDIQRVSDAGTATYCGSHFGDGSSGAGGDADTFGGSEAGSLSDASSDAGAGGDGGGGGDSGCGGGCGGGGD